jgi:hypothetical protein
VSGGIEGGGGGGISMSAHWARGKKLALRYEMVRLSVRPVCSSVD